MSEEKWEEMSVTAGRTNYFYSSEAVKWAAETIEALQAELESTQWACALATSRLSPADLEYCREASSKGGV